MTEMCSGVVAPPSDRGGQGDFIRKRGFHRAYKRGDRSKSVVDFMMDFSMKQLVDQTCRILREDFQKSIMEPCSLSAMLEEK